MQLFFGLCFGQIWPSLVQIFGPDNFKMSKIKFLNTWNLLWQLSVVFSVIPNYYIPPSNRKCNVHWEVDTGRVTAGGWHRGGLHQEDTGNWIPWVLKTRVFKTMILSCWEKSTLEVETLCYLEENISNNSSNRVTLGGWHREVDTGRLTPGGWHREVGTGRVTPGDTGRHWQTQTDTCRHWQYLINRNLVLLRREHK